MDVLALPVLHYVLATLFIIICILVMLVVLIQKGRGGGLSGAFGGVGGHSAFGAKTGDVFTWITVVLAACFLGMAVILNYVYVRLPVQATGKPAPTVPAPTPEGGETTPAEAPADTTGQPPTTAPAR
jgi:preprotein translocase subunit SecG